MVSRHIAGEYILGNWLLSCDKGLKWVCTQTCPQQSNNDKKEVSSIVSLNESLKTDKRARLNRAQNKNLPLISKFSETANRSSAVPVVYRVSIRFQSSSQHTNRINEG